MTGLMRQIEEALQVVCDHSQLVPEVGIILGTGLGRLAVEIDQDAAIPYGEIPHFPLSTVESHEGRLILGRLGGKPVVVMQGRFHCYEGYTMQQITFPVRVMRRLGASTLLASNVSGGMNPLFAPGDIMLVTDHINLLGGNPLVGRNDPDLGPRFPDMSEPYSQSLISLAERVALEEKIRLQKGVYVAVPGPNLETRAEYRFLRAIGADVVGMSTVPEVIAAVHAGMRVLALSVITDSCLPDALEPADIASIISIAEGAEPKLTQLMKRIVADLDASDV